jgi:hypothetical protein
MRRKLAVAIIALWDAIMIFVTIHAFRAVVLEWAVVPMIVATIALQIGMFLL